MEVEDSPDSGARDAGTAGRWAPGTSAALRVVTRRPAPWGTPDTSIAGTAGGRFPIERRAAGDRQPPASPRHIDRSADGGWPIRRSQETTVRTRGSRRLRFEGDG